MYNVDKPIQTVNPKTRFSFYTTYIDNNFSPNSQKTKAKIIKTDGHETLNYDGHEFEKMSYKNRKAYRLKMNIGCILVAEVSDG